MIKVKNSDLTPKLNFGFTMIELVFVIVLIGILATIGGNLLPDNRLLNDTNILTMKIKEKQKNAIGKSNYSFGDEHWLSDDNKTCLSISKTGIEEDEKNEEKPYVFHSTISLSGNERLCFDEYGRPYANGALLSVNLDVNLTLDRKFRELSVMPMSGYVIINN